MSSFADSVPVKILLGEDNPADVYLIRQALDEHAVQYSMEVAAHGGEMMAAIADEQMVVPDLIVLDLNLPRHDGWEVLRAIRSTVHLRAIPIVVLTSSDSPKDRALASDYGASAYLRKSSNLEEFMAIGKILKTMLAEARPTGAAKSD